MTANALFNPTQLVLKLNENTIQQAWKQSQSAATPASRWQAYLNLLVEQTFLPWVQAEEDDTAKASFARDTLANLWEVVTGTAVTLKAAKLVLIPTEAEDLSELRVPQEWIDIPEWIADYYLAVQVNVDGGYLRIWGYNTHQQLKNHGTYNPSDRTYTLPETDLITDINVFWVAQELCPDEVTQATVEPLATISATQAENLIQRLGNIEQLLPRLAIPFSTWGALIRNPNWCQLLAEKRRGVVRTISVLQWLQTGVSNLAAEFGWRQIELKPSAIGARGTTTASDSRSDTTPKVGLARQLTIANQPYELKILPSIEEDNVWRFELSNLALGGMIPAGFKLRLLTEDLQPFEDNEDIATEAVDVLYLEVGIDAGEGLIWQVEPTPENYQTEVLYF